MKIFKTTAIAGICLMALINGSAFARGVTDESSGGGPDSNRSNLGILTAQCGGRSIPTSDIKFKVNIYEEHGFKTNLGNQVTIYVSEVTSKAVVVSFAMTNKNSGQSINVAPLMVYANATDVTPDGEIAPPFTLITANGEMCLLLYSK